MIRLLILLTAVAGTGLAPQLPSGYDPDRLSRPKMEKLVEAPLAEVRANRLDKAVADLEVLRSKITGADAASALARADLDEAFGVLVHIEWQTHKQPSHLPAALPVLKRAIGSYRVAFGARHPEVALALQSWADVLLAVDARGNVPAARSAYCEAFRIRLDSLGPESAETGSALAQVIKLAPSGTVDAATLERINPEPRIDFSHMPVDSHPLSYLPPLRAALENARQEREAAYKALAMDQRFAGLCPSLSAKRGG